MHEAVPLMREYHCTNRLKIREDKSNTESHGLVMHRFFGDQNNECKNTLINERLVHDTTFKSNDSTGFPKERKSFADIVRKKNVDDADNANIGPIGPTTASGEAKTIGCDFCTIENASVRSVLENVFKEPDITTALDPNQKSRSWPFDFRSREPGGVNNVCINCATKASVVPRTMPLEQPPLASHLLLNCILDEIILAASGGYLAWSKNFANMLTDVLCQRIRRLHPSSCYRTTFACPRCGEVTKLETTHPEGFGSVGDRYLTNLPRFKERSCDSEQYSRRHGATNIQSSPGPFTSTKTRNKSDKTNLFGGPNSKKKNRREMREQ